MMDKLGYNQALHEANRCLLCEDSPCFHGCPAGVNPKKFIRKIKFGNFAGAVRYLKQANVLAGSCSYICPCLDTCASKCTSDKLDDPINIIGLQRFACDWERSEGMIDPQPGKKSGVKVAIIGSGPAGLSCASELAVLGHDPVVFDSSNEAGGMLRHIIPDFRLPGSVLDHEIEFVKKLGVSFQLSTEVNDINKLLAEGFKAVFVATGVWKSKKSGINGEDKKGVFQAMEFIKLAKAGRLELPTNNRALVIGGGDTAIDAARILARAGCKVTMVYRRSRSDMPAYRPDITEAEKEGVEPMFNTLPRAIVGKENAESVRFVRIKWSGSGRASADYTIEGSEFTMPCNFVVLATGQEAMNFFDLRPSPKGFIAIDVNMMTSKAGVFAGGDIVSGPATAVAAVGAGKTAAGFISKFISSKFGVRS